MGRGTVFNNEHYFTLLPIAGFTWNVMETLRKVNNHAKRISVGAIGSLWTVPRSRLDSQHCDQADPSSDPTTP